MNCFLSIEKISIFYGSDSSKGFLSPMKIKLCRARNFLLAQTRSWKLLHDCTLFWTFKNYTMSKKKDDSYLRVMVSTNASFFFPGLTEVDMFACSFWIGIPWVIILQKNAPKILKILQCPFYIWVTSERRTVFECHGDWKSMLLVSFWVVFLRCVVICEGVMLVFKLRKFYGWI